ncbi:MAG: protein kinase [Crocinitomicaceae bacterium]|nr:protein kinase [Crocinitomicaceae bacterium]
MSNSLPNNYKLNNRHTILHQIGQGGFGITYKAYDSVFDRDVCIKELFLSGNSRREKSLSITSQAIGSIDFSYFKNKFLEEAKKLAKFDHPNIVKVLEYFEANNTAYMVMDFVEGKNLKAYVQEKGKLDEETALGIFNQLLQATEVIHAKNYLHRDIKPDNIIITPNNKAVLIDFGTAKFHDDDNGDTSTLILLSHGYAPPEQYSNQNKKDKYTDIYSLGATLYFMLTGEKPLQATDRTINQLKPITAINPNVSNQVESAVIKAMELIPSNRYQKVGDMEKVLKVKQTKAPSPYTKRIDNIVKVFLITLAVALAISVWKAWLDSKPRTNTWNELSSEKMGDSVIDPDSDTSTQITIGNQIWMTKNLNVDRFRNGDPIPQAQTDEEWRKAGKNKEPAWCYYYNDESRSSIFKNSSYKYGKIYNRYAIEDLRGIAPEGWRIPSPEDWKQLIYYLNLLEPPGPKLDSLNLFDYDLGGYRESWGEAFGIMHKGYWYSISEVDSAHYWFDRRYDSVLKLDFDDSFRKNNISENFRWISAMNGQGFSVRCLKNTDKINREDVHLRPACFHLIVESYSNKKVAEEYLADLKSQGYQHANLLNITDDLHYVSIASFAMKSEAAGEINNYRTRGFYGIWLCKHCL